MATRKEAFQRGLQELIDELDVDSAVGVPASKLAEYVVGNLLLVEKYKDGACFDSLNDEYVTWSEIAEAMDKSPAPLKFESLRPYRFESNHEEKRFFDAAVYMLTSGGRPSEQHTAMFLRRLMGVDLPNPILSEYLATVSQRDVDVALTILQWLGSSVGQYFLRELGYERETKS
jgi:hypothetical protein